VPRQAGSHGERAERIAERATSEIAGVALRLRRMAHGTLPMYHEEPMMDAMRFSLIVPPENHGVRKVKKRKYNKGECFAEITIRTKVFKS
jgi:hypothetical protein